MDVVVLELQPHGGLGFVASEGRAPDVAGVQPGGDSPIGLGELVSMNGVGEKVREVGEQLQPARDHIGIHLGEAGAFALLPGP